MNQTYVLTKSTRDEKCRGLDVSRLPRTIIQAIEVTRRLGYTYLWVDALCIAQDDIGRNGGEISLMGQIYRDSEITIIAAIASSSTEGFLTITCPPEYFVRPFEIPVNVQDGIETLSFGYREYYKGLKDPINSRAWTFQERILSSRCLIFSYTGLVWSCQTCERNPNGPPGAPTMFPRLLPKSGALLNQKESQHELRQTWLTMRNEYTSRKLTYGSDKLPAISAVDFQIFEKTGWTYLAGIWKEHSFLELHWQSEKHSTMPMAGATEAMNPLLPRPLEYRAPSWSWACIDGLVVDEGEDLRDVFQFKILSCKVDYLNVDMPQKFNFGPVSTGVLTVEGRVIDLNWRWASNGDDLTNIFLAEDDGGTTYNIGEAVLDAIDPELTTGTKVHCLAMSILSYVGRTRLPVEGLLLLPQREYPFFGSFRRIGLFKIYSSTTFQSVRETTIQIT